MKNLLSFFALVLFTFPSFAQKGDDCPAIDWVKTKNLDSTFYTFNEIAETKDGGMIKVGYYYHGCYNVEGLNVPPVSGNIRVAVPNMFLMKADSNDQAEWIIPFEMVEYYDVPQHPVAGNGHSMYIDDQDNIHLIVHPVHSVFDVFGNKYGFANLNEWDSRYRRYEYYFKINPKGLLIDEYAINTYSPNDNTGTIFGYLYPARVPRIIHVDTADSSIIFNIYSYETSDSLILFDHIKIPTIDSQYSRANHSAYYIVKVNKHFKVQWAKPMVNAYFPTTTKGKNKNELYIVGSIFPFSNSSPYDSSVIIDNVVLTSDTKLGGYFMTKLNTSNGQFSDSKFLVTGRVQFYSWWAGTGGWGGGGGMGAYNPFGFYGGSYGNFGWAGNDKLAFIDDSNNLYFVGGFGNANTIKIDKKKIANYPDTINSGSFLLKYNLDKKRHESFTVIGTYTMPVAIQYLPRNKQIIFTGAYSNKKVFFLNDTVDIPSVNGGVGNLFWMTFNAHSKKISDYAEWNYDLKSNWLVYAYSHYDSNWVGSMMHRVYDDWRGDVHILGSYSGRLTWDWKNTNSGKTIPVYRNVGTQEYELSHGLYHTKLTALTSHILHDSTKMQAAQTNAKYQWHECQSNKRQSIPGATGRTFVPANANTKYAVEVYNSYCTVISDCQKLSVPVTQSLSSVQIYPNPVSNTLHLSNLPIGVDIAVFDVMGRKVFSSSVQQSNFKINTEAWTQGVYLVQLNYQGERWMEKVYHAKGFAR